MAYAPDLMFEHGLDMKKGWFDMASLDYAAKMRPDLGYDIPRGRVVHVDSNGYFTPGCGNVAIGIFLINGTTDADVSNPGTTAGGLFMHKAISPSGKLSGVVATGGYEISTTEFDTAQTYVPGTLLTAPAGSSATDAGLLTNQSAVQFVNPICGVVSSGAGKNHNGVMALSFWSVWLPGAA